MGYGIWRSSGATKTSDGEILAAVATVGLMAVRANASDPLTIRLVTYVINALLQLESGRRMGTASILIHGMVTLLDHPHAMAADDSRTVLTSLPQKGKSGGSSGRCSAGHVRRSCLLTRTSGLRKTGGSAYPVDDVFSATLPNQLRFPSGWMIAMAIDLPQGRHTDDVQNKSMVSENYLQTLVL